MKIGYPCINRTLLCTATKTFRLASYSESLLCKTIENNLDCLQDILAFNVAHNILFFRISSDLIPFASHPICSFNWQKHFKETLTDIGMFICAHNVRISMHPDQFIVLNSPRVDVVKRSVRELAYHVEVLDAMGLDDSAKLQLHIGGVYGNKKRSMQRFIKKYQKLDITILTHLVIENDDRRYTISDCLDIHDKTGVPVLIDTFHHALKNNGEQLKDLLKCAVSTWELSDGIPMMDYSSQELGMRPGQHAKTLDSTHFLEILAQIRPFDFDIMLEIKDKERSALKALHVAAADDRLIQVQATL